MLNILAQLILWILLSFFFEFQGNFPLDLFEASLMMLATDFTEASHGVKVEVVMGKPPILSLLLITDISPSRRSGCHFNMIISASLPVFSIC